MFVSIWEERDSVARKLLFVHTFGSQSDCRADGRGLTVTALWTGGLN